jgi:hypothetical protein
MMLAWCPTRHDGIARDDDGKDYKFPLEVIRAYVQAAEPDSDQ